MTPERIDRRLRKSDYSGVWDHETNVVVLGTGLAGMVTAMELHDMGEDFLLVEKAPEAKRGGGTRASGQGLFFTTNKEKLIQYQRNLNKPNVIPEDVLETWASHMVQIQPWISERRI